MNCNACGQQPARYRNEFDETLCDKCDSKAMTKNFKPRDRTGRFIKWRTRA